MIANADSVEVTWSLIAFVGVVLAVIAISLAWLDYRAAKRFGDEEYIDQAWHNIRREIIRALGQTSNLVPGVIAMFLPPTGIPSPNRAAMVLFLSAGSACVTVNTAWDLVHRYLRSHRSPFQRQDDRIDAIAAQFTPNGGDSLRDVVDELKQVLERMETNDARVAAHLAIAQKAVDNLKADVDASRVRADAVQDSDPGAAADAASQSGE